MINFGSVKQAWIRGYRMSLSLLAFRSGQQLPDDLARTLVIAYIQLPTHNFQLKTIHVG
jgi:hypothetical protein